MVSHTQNEHRVPELIPVLSSQPAGDRSHKPGGRLPLLSARPVVAFPAADYHCSLAGTKLYYIVTEAHLCKQHVQVCTRQRDSRDSNPRPVDHKSSSLTTRPPSHTYITLSIINSHSAFV